MVLAHFENIPFVFFLLCLAVNRPITNATKHFLYFIAEQSVFKQTRLKSIKTD